MEKSLCNKGKVKTKGLAIQSASIIDSVCGIANRYFQKMNKRCEKLLGSLLFKLPQEIPLLPIGPQLDKNNNQNQ